MVGIEIAYADGTQLARFIGFFQVAISAVAVTERLVKRKVTVRGGIYNQTYFGVCFTFFGSLHNIRHAEALYNIKLSVSLPS